MRGGETACADVALSVVVPCFNEAARVGATLADMLVVLRGRGEAFEIMVVDDGSTDATADVVAKRFAQDPEVKLVHLPTNRGKGGAVRAGMAEARGRLRLFADADGSTPIREIARLEAAVRAGASIAIGSRLDRRLVKTPLHRRCLGWVFRAIIRWVAVKTVDDTQCGFKLFTEEAAKQLFGLSHLEGYAFDVELLFLAEQLGYRIDEVCVRWEHRPGSKVRVIRDGLAMLGEVVRMRIHHRRRTRRLAGRKA